MHLDLTADESRVLYDMLSNHLPELRMEVARTDSHEYRHRLVERLNLCEKLLDQLADGPVPDASGSP